METQTPIERCIRAMSFVYGDFNSLSDEECKTWVPSSDPGTGGHRGRRLWSDAFGVLNFTSLFLETGKKRYLVLAEQLVQVVHETLGRTRDGLHRLPGATEKKPLLGGLRSGRMAEKDDGQVHRELMIWMFALDRLGKAANDGRWDVLAVELAEAAHPRFTVHKLSGGMRLVGKVSGDMEDVVDVKTGTIDAMMGWAVFRVLKDAGGGSVLRREVEEYERIMECEKPVEQELRWVGIGLWVSSLWKEEEWSEDTKRRGMKRVEEVFLGVKEALNSNEEDLESLVVRELGACLGVRCWADGKTEEEDEMLRATERVVRLWERRLEGGDENSATLRGEVKGMASVMAGAVVLTRGLRRDP